MSIKLLKPSKFFNFSSLVINAGNKYGQEWGEWGNVRLIDFAQHEWTTRETRECVGKNGTELSSRICGGAKIEQTLVNIVQIGVQLEYMEARNHCAAIGTNCFFLNLSMKRVGWGGGGWHNRQIFNDFNENYPYLQALNVFCSYSPTQLFKSHVALIP